MTRHFSIVDSRVVYGDILLLILEPKTNNDSLEFNPGQYVAITFYKYGRHSPVRCFTIASSPSDMNLQLAMRITGKFTRAAAKLKAGDSVKVQGPYGEFTLGNARNRAVMLAGGIGITPFMSMLRYSTQNQLRLPLNLIYTNRVKENIPFYEELLELERQNDRLNVNFFATDGGSGHKIKPGRINETHISRLTTGEFVGSTYYLCGPKKFTTHFKRLLEAYGVEPYQIMIESFTSTSKINNTEKLWSPAMTYGLTFATFLLTVGAITVIDLHNTIEANQSKAATSLTSLVPQTTSNISTPVTYASSTPSTPAATTNIASSTSSTTQSTPTVTKKSNYSPPMSTVS